MSFQRRPVQRSVPPGRHIEDHTIRCSGVSTEGNQRRNGHCDAPPHEARLHLLHCAFVTDKCVELVTL